MKKIYQTIIVICMLSVNLIAESFNPAMIPIVNHILFSDSINSYSSLGPYTPTRYPDEGLQDGFVVYSPENAITPNMPVVLFLEGGGDAPHIDDHKGLMKFMASKGYFVIGAESGGSYDSNYAKNIFENGLNSKNGGLKTSSKYGTMGRK